MGDGANHGAVQYWFGALAHRTELVDAGNRKHVDAAINAVFAGLNPGIIAAQTNLARDHDFAAQTKCKSI